VPISRQYVLSHIPETQLRSLLVLLPLNLWVTYLLKIKLRHLKRRPANRQDPVNQADRFEMTSDFVL